MIYLSNNSGHCEDNFNDHLETDITKNIDIKSEFTVKHVSTDEDGNTIKILYDNKYGKLYI